MTTVDLENVVISNEAVQKIPEGIANDNCLIAFEEVEDYIYIAIEKDITVSLEEELKFITGKNIKLFYADKMQIINSINTYYCKYSVENAIKTIESQSIDSFRKQSIKVSEDEKFQEAPIVKIVNSIINGAINQCASDIHFEPFQNEALVRFRVDGIINQFMPIPKNIFVQVCTRLKIMALMDISEKRIPQDGKIKYINDNNEYDLRISTLPTIYGEKIVIRILYRSNEMNFLDTLGFSDKDVKTIKAMIENRHGIILVTGHTARGIKVR